MLLTHEILKRYLHLAYVTSPRVTSPSGCNNGTVGLALL